MFLPIFEREKIRVENQEPVTLDEQAVDGNVALPNRLQRPSQRL
jgi:hypothetical protein